jgi:hypothetical protein
MEWTSYIRWDDDWFILEQHACFDFYSADTGTIKLELIDWCLMPTLAVFQPYRGDWVRIRTYNVCSADTGTIELESELTMSEVLTLEP